MTKAKRKARAETRHKLPERCVVAVYGDTHGGHVLGLCNPDTEFELVRRVPSQDGRGFEEESWTERVQTNDLQNMSWGWFLDDVTCVKKLAGHDPLIVYHGGDVGAGSQRPKEWVTTVLAGQLAIIKANMDPWYEGDKKPDKVRISTGTASHDFGEGSGARIVAAYLRENHKADARAGYHTEHRIMGKRFDVAHHGPGPGTRNWLRGNVLQLYVQSLMMDMLDRGETPPDVILRFHYHQDVPRTVTLRRNGGEYETRAYILPSYCWADDFATQAAQSPTYVTMGMRAFEIERERGIVKVHRFMRTVDFRSVENLIP